MPFSVTAHTEDGCVVIAKNTDRQDALDTAVRVANARTCDVVVEDLVTLERLTFSPASAPEDEPVVDETVPAKKNARQRAARAKA